MTEEKTVLRWGERKVEFMRIGKVAWTMCDRALGGDEIVVYVREGSEWMASYNLKECASGSGCQIALDALHERMTDLSGRILNALDRGKV
jgi:hypothetical protein